MIEAVSAVTAPPALTQMDAATGADPAAGPGFAEALTQAARSAYGAVAAGEAAANAGALGEASLHDVVHAVVSAELTVTAVTSIRDRAVAAYQDLLRMPV